MKKKAILATFIAAGGLLLAAGGTFLYLDMKSPLGVKPLSVDVAESPDGRPQKTEKTPQLRFAEPF